MEELIKLQENLGDVEKKLAGKYDGKKICNVPWKTLKYNVMAGDKSFKQLKVPLNEH